ncbi:Glutamate--tRNA ligase [Planctomycetales bacterium 10988]|nr:Glutamate--tRNA ligase [Planctomycetales bacterium 10988]
MVRTRFAPSPTGYLHIGGVRTALYNWLYAKQHQGQFILRIDDTDQARNVEAALAPILAGFRWLGLDWDEGPEIGGPHGPYFQSQRKENYQQAVQTLLDKGFAYRDYSRTEEIQAERELAKEEKRSYIYDRKWMAETEEDAKRFEAEGRQGVVRLKMPREGECKFHDLVRGDVSFPWKSEQDMVIQKADGSCLYHLATVVDDHDFEITHVIRAEEHLPNTPRQIFIAQGLGYDLPEYAHVPYVAEPGSKSKLSKRKIRKYLKNPDFKKLYDQGEVIAQQIGLEITSDDFNPVLVDFYREVGFLPAAILNALLLLGWAYDDQREDFTLEEMIELFTLQKVNSAPASFDPAKMQAFQERYMSRVPLPQMIELTRPYLEKAKLYPTAPTQEEELYLSHVIKAAGDRLKVAGDILEFEDFFVKPEDLTYDEKAFEKRLQKPDDAEPLLKEFTAILKELEPFTEENLEKALKDFVAEKEIKIGQIIHALRVAVTGKVKGFGMFETLAILGKQTCLERIEFTLNKLVSTN